MVHAGGGGADGRRPAAAVFVEGDGAIYGTTNRGGSSDYGIVFKIQTAGSGYTELRSFGAGADGRSLKAALVQGQDGALYGATELGGDDNAGTLFRLDLDGANYTKLYDFAGGADGEFPRGGLIQGTDGLL